MVLVSAETAVHAPASFHIEAGKQLIALRAPGLLPADYQADGHAGASLKLTADL